MSADDYPALPGRRKFVAKAMQAGAGAALMSSGAAAAASPVASSAQKITQGQAGAPLVNFTSLPSLVLVQNESGRYETAARDGSRFTTPKVEVRLVESADSTNVLVTCPRSPLSRIVLRWKTSFPEDTLFLGDAWERSYGDLQWRYWEPERVMPWYFAAHQPASNRSFLLGVKTQPSAMCSWTVDGDGISLWLDLRNGGSGSLPGDRPVAAASIVSLTAHADETPFTALQRFCGALCKTPHLPKAPVCGSNSWYYTYGNNFNAETMRRDATLLAELAGTHHNRPFCVIDGGWSPGGGGPGGPWTAGDPKTFPDMPGLAADMKKIGVRPGIWIRPTALHIVDNAARIRSGPVKDTQKPLDPTLLENVASIHDDITRMRSWGYELIKHDFSTWDLFGRWGPNMGAEITDNGWHFHDQSLTNAEIILNLYRSLREAAGDAVLIGCNTIGHLGAGLFELQRIGDDVSGRVWERTRRMGINALAFRLAQNGRFFSCDPDCASHTEKIPWELDRQFLDLVARSGTALFVSVDPEKITAEQKQVFTAAMQVALSGGDANGCEPLDWLYNTTPERWHFGAQRVQYDWSEQYGANPFIV